MTEALKLQEHEEKLLEAALSGTLSRTADWLKFAETKNAALLTFSSAWLVAIGNLCFGGKLPPGDIATALGWASTFIIISAFFALWALLPKIPLLPRKTKKDHKNLLYYGEIEGRGAQWLVSEMRSTYLTEEYKTFSERYLLDLADQISDLSVVASRKYRLFSFGATAMVLALLAFIISLLGAAAWAWAFSLLHSCLQR